LVEVISVILVMLVVIVVSETISRMLPVAIPLPLVQIALGAAVTAFADLGVTLDPDVFFLLLIPPLLFLDGWRIPKEGLFRDAAAILELALGLVLFTVVGMGFFIHWMIPAVPLAVAFALAAVLSPTDPVAVSAITSRALVPKRVMHILQSESLLNDASGIVCMRFALAAALTGTFSLAEAAGTFLWVALGGIVLGVAVTWVVTRIKDWLGAAETWVVTRTKSWGTTRFGEDVGAQILLNLLIPFTAYLVAEHLHCSGILAAVAAGITMSYVEISGRARGETRLQRAAVWNTVQFAANGVVFVLLGEQLPAILSGAAAAVSEAGGGHVWRLAVYVLTITAALGLLRFLWVWTSLRLSLFRAARRGQRPQAPSIRLVAAVSLAGVRGAVTLAGVLTFPLFMPDGSAFPARDLVTFLAAGVIVLSLVTATIALPGLLTKLPLPPEDSQQEAENQVRAAAAMAAIQAIEAAQQRMADGRSDAGVFAEAAARVMEIHRRRLDGLDAGQDYASIEEVDRQLRLAALRAERDEVFRSARSRRIDDQTARKLIRELDLLEARLAH
jgi:monovalent cation/hydrogen antiporter